MITMPPTPAPRLDRRKLADTLILARYRSEKTADQVGKETGTSKSTICRLERVDHMPRIDTVLSILHWLGRPLEHFLIYPQDT